MKFADEPDYQYLRQLLLNELSMQQGELQFDWIGTNIKRSKSNIAKVAKAREFQIGRKTFPTKQETSGNHLMQITTSKMVSFMNKLIPFPIIPSIVVPKTSTNANSVIIRPPIF